MTAGIRARDAAPAPTRRAATKPGSQSEARAVTRASRTSTSAVAPKLPIRLSRMMSSAFARFSPAPSPSAVSASPVLVQRPGRQHHGGHRQDGAGQARQPGPARYPECEAADAAHQGAHEREQVDRRREVAHRDRAGHPHRQPSQEEGGNSQVLEHVDSR